MAMVGGWGVFVCVDWKHAPARTGGKWFDFSTCADQPSPRPRAGWPTERWIPDVTELSSSASGPPVDLVIWPETMLPGFGFEPETEVLAQLRSPWAVPSRMVQDWAKASDTPCSWGRTSGMVWLLMREDCVDRQVNASVLVRPDGTHERAEKIGLTPFGEFIPLVSTVPELRQFLMNFVPDGSPIPLALLKVMLRADLCWVRFASPPPSVTRAPCPP